MYRKVVLSKYISRIKIIWYNINVIINEEEALKLNEIYKMF